MALSHWCRQPHRWGTEEVETERRVLDAFRAVHFFEQGHRPNMQAMPAAYLQQRRSLVHTAVQMADTLELPVGGGCVAEAQTTHPQLLRISVQLLRPQPARPPAALPAAHGCFGPNCWCIGRGECRAAAVLQIHAALWLTKCRAAWNCSTTAAH